MANNKSLVGEVWGFLRERKVWWIAPIIIMLVFIGIVMVVGSSSGVLSPFIYTLF